MNNLLSLITICSLAIACNKSSNSTGEQLTDEALVAEGVKVNIESRITPNAYETTLTSSTNEDKQKINADFYALNAGIGCNKSAEGKFTNDYSKNPKVIDSSLKIDDVFTEQTATSGISNAFDGQMTYAVSKIADKQVVYNLNFNFNYNLFEGINYDMDSFFSSKPHGTKIYDNLDEDYKIKYNYSQKGLALIESFKNKNTENNYYWTCWRKDSSDYKNTVSLIKYEMNGQKIPAILEESTSYGKLTCEKRTYSDETNASKVLKTIELEKGESTWKTIRSRVVKSLYLVLCEGQQLYHQSITKANGKTISAYSNKLQAPVR